MPCGVTSSSDQGHPPFSPSSTTAPTDMPTAQKGKHRRATRKQVVFYSFLSLLRRDHNTENGSPFHGGTVWSVSTRTRGVGGAGPAFPLSSPPGTTCCSPCSGATQSPARSLTWCQASRGGRSRRCCLASRAQTARQRTPALSPCCPSPEHGPQPNASIQPSPARAPVQG